MAGSNNPTDLPGYYFDRERNRYFRLLPGANNHNPLTRQTISARRVTANATNLKTKRWYNIVQLMQKRSYGKKCYEIDCVNSILNSCSGSDVMRDRNCPVGTVCKIKPDSTNRRMFEFVVADDTPNRYYTTVRRQHDVHQILLATKSLALCFLSDPTKFMYADMMGGRICLCDISTNEHMVIYYPTPLSCAAASTDRFRYVASYNYSSTVVLISNTDEYFRDYSRRRGGSHYSEVRLYLSVLCQHFSQTSPIHFNGLRGGSVVGLDLRTLRQNWRSCILNGSATNPHEIYSLRDGNSLLVGYDNAGATPAIALWDMRYSEKPVFEYQTALTRRCSLSRKPLFSVHVDSEEHVVTSVLPDYRARFWSLKTGEVLLSYPSVEEKDTYATAAAYASDWEIMQGKMGALVYVKAPTHEGYELLQLQDAT